MEDIHLKQPVAVLQLARMSRIVLVPVPKFITGFCVDQRSNQLTKI